MRGNDWVDEHMDKRNVPALLYRLKDVRPSNIPALSNETAFYQRIKGTLLFMPDLMQHGYPQLRANAKGFCSNVIILDS